MGGGPFVPRSKDEMAHIPWFVDWALSMSAGITSACCAAPFILTVDRAVTENSAGKSGLGQALMKGFGDILMRPQQIFLRLPFWMVAGVYGATYATANSIDVACERTLHDRDEESAKMVHSGVKLFGVTAVNMSAGVAKDAAFARMFGAATTVAPPAVGMATIGLFAFRDLLTIGSAFIVPKLLADSLVAAGTMDEGSAASSAQLLSPIGMQLVLTPIHLLALNMYNEPKATAGERAAQVSRLVPASTVARMGRFGCAYGVGGVMNTTLTQRARDWARERYCPPALAGVSAGQSAGPSRAAGGSS